MNLSFKFIFSSLLFFLIAAFPFHEMLDSAQVVAMVRIDRKWSTADTVPPASESNEPYKYVQWINHYTAEIMALFVKDGSVSIPNSPIHIAYDEVTVYPNGTIESVAEWPSFNEGDVFLAPFMENLWHKSDTEIIYDVDMRWFYRVFNDSILLYPEETIIPLSCAIDSLYRYFLKYY